MVWTLIKTFNKSNKGLNNINRRGRLENSLKASGFDLSTDIRLSKTQNSVYNNLVNVL
jgi:hypothetical protein